MSRMLTCETWLLVETAKRGYSDLRVVSARTTKPTCGPRQVAMKLVLELPSGLFTEPTVTARVKVDGAVAPEKITAETVAGVEAALTSAGFAVRVVADEPPQ